MILERLKTILSHFNLTPSSFADAIGVPRSSISHLLSGRNKPSLDFVLKLVHEFPEVDLYWLLYGKGVFPPSKEAPIEVHGSNETIMDSIQGTKDSSLLNNEKISKIVFFYTDGTFETYRPKK